LLFFALSDSDEKRELEKKDHWGKSLSVGSTGKKGKLSINIIGEARKLDYHLESLSTRHDTMIPECLTLSHMSGITIKHESKINNSVRSNVISPQIRRYTFTRVQEVEVTDCSTLINYVYSTIIR
jgi:hypothetical protein